MGRDARPEEPADVVPAAATEHEARGGEHAAGVQPPRRAPPWARWHRELDARDRPTASHDACELSDGRRRVRDVAQQVGEREGVERRVGERQLLAAPEHEPDAIGEAGGRDGPLAPPEHALGQVDADDRRRRARGQGAGDRARSARDVEDPARRRGDDVSDGLVVPATVLSEREQLCEAVVPRDDR